MGDFPTKIIEETHTPFLAPKIPHKCICKENAKQPASQPIVNGSAAVNIKQSLFCCILTWTRCTGQSTRSRHSASSGSRAVRLRRRSNILANSLLSLAWLSD